MKRSERHLYVSISIALILWFIMFSKLTSGIANFWVEMSISAVALSILALTGLRGEKMSCTGLKEILLQIVAGVTIAFALWGIFWIGNAVSSILFDFARPQVEDVYGMKTGTSPMLIGILLLVLIGPAEEFFWRGYVQRTIANLKNPAVAFVITLAIYSFAHIWSGNFMLVMAAMVAGAVWGLLYWWKPSLLPALIVSHALWDALVFVILPI